MNPDLPVVHLALQALGWVLTMTLWQGAAVGAVLYPLLLFARRRPGRLRSGLAWSGLLVLLFLPLLSGGRIREIWTEHQECWSIAERDLAAAQSARCWAHSVPRTSGADAHAPPSHSAAGEAEPEQEWVKPLPPGKVAALSATPALGWAGAAWLLVVVLLLGRRLGGIGRLALLARRSPPAIAALERTVQVLGRGLGIERPVRVRAAPAADVPMAFGWSRPTILLPPHAPLLAPEELETILLHELAHIRRGDLQSNLALALARALLFYHPVAWWLARIIREEREFACDDVVLRTSRSRPSVYVRALLTLEAERPVGRAELQAAHAGLAANGTDLLPRIHRMARPAQPASRVSRTALAIIAAVAIVGTVLLTPLLRLGPTPQLSAWSIMTLDVHRRLH